jgi:hypothetical protein
MKRFHANRTLAMLLFPPISAEMVSAAAADPRLLCEKGEDWRREFRPRIHPQHRQRSCRRRSTLVDRSVEIPTLF